MKRTFLVFGFLLMIALPLMAEHVDPETARKVATTFLNNNGTKTNQLTDLSKAVGFPNLYIFNTEESFVIIAADNCAKPILGYSLTGKFETEGMPENVRFWLQGYNDEIQYAIDHQLRNTSETVQQWKNLTEGKANTAKATYIVEPLIQTTWGQGNPYKNFCPSGAVTGCVATAMAQVMNYWNYPTRGIGTHNYQYSTYGNISADFGSTEYDWDNMLFSYSGTSTQAQQDAVATLMYHCGVSVEMEYGPSESSSNIQRSSFGMKTYFNYNTSYIESEIINNDSIWAATLRNELDNGRPILYGGSNKGTGAGHAFVCDGYNDNGEFHFNWGWTNGLYNGDFLLTSLTPGSGHNYTHKQKAVIGIEPLTSAALPLKLSISNTDQDVTLNWTDTMNCTSYNVYRNDALISTTTERTFSDNEPSLGTNTYYVRGWNNGLLMLPSNYETASFDYPIPSASGLTATVDGDNLSLSWNASEWCYPSLADDATFAYVDKERLAKDQWYGWPQGDFTLSWGHRYPAEVLSPYAGKALYEVSFFTMFPGAFDIVIYQGTTDDHPIKEIARNSVTTARFGWIQVGFDAPVPIDSTDDLWIFVINTDNQVHDVYYKDVIDNKNGCYFAGGDPIQLCSHGIDSDISWLIIPHLTDGSYSYNLYQDGVRVLENLSDTICNASLETDASNLFSITTNYYGGESAESNQIGFAMGSATLPTLELNANDTMTLNSGSTLTVTGTLSNDNPGNLIIEDGAQLIHPNYSVLATMNKTILPYTEGTNNGWYTIASPVDSANVSIATTGAYDLYAYDEQQVLWLNQENSDNNITQFKVGQGFLYANAAQQSIAFAGNMKATDEQISVPLSFQSNDTNLKGFNLVGNPFTRNLGPDDITLGGSALSNYYVVEGGSQLEVRKIDETPIKPGQGFLVQATANDQYLVFNPTRSKSQNKPAYISIEAGDETFTDRAFVQFAESNQLHKMTLSNNTAQLSVLYNKAKYAAVTVEDDITELPLNFKAAHDGTHSLSISISNLDLDYLHLIDHLTGADIDLLTTPSYTFEAKTDDYPSRFRLMFGETTDGDDNNENPSEGTIQILDMTGRVVATDRNAQLAPGVYLLRTINGNNVQTEKIIIK